MEEFPLSRTKVDVDHVGHSQLSEPSKLTHSSSTANSSASLNNNLSIVLETSIITDAQEDSPHTPSNTLLKLEVSQLNRLTPTTLRTDPAPLMPILSPLRSMVDQLTSLLVMKRRPRLLFSLMDPSQSPSKLLEISVTTAPESTALLPARMDNKTSTMPFLPSDMELKMERIIG